MPNHDVLSPLTRLPIEVVPNGNFSEYRENQIGEWLLSSELFFAGFSPDQAPLYVSNRKLEGFARERVLALARSKVWEAMCRGRKIPFFMSAARRDDLEERGLLSGPGYDPYQIVTSDELLQESESLTLEVKAVRTLANLVLAEREIGKGLDCLYHGPLNSLATTFRSPVYIPGAVYGSPESESNIVLRLLSQRGLIRRSQYGSSDSIEITPVGYVFSDNIRLGLSESRKAFLVCRFTGELE